MELWTWSDRGVSSKSVAHLRPRGDDRGPVMRLVAHRDVEYDRATVLTTPQGEERAQDLVGDLTEALGGPVRCRVLQVTDPSDHRQLFGAVADAVAGSGRSDVVLSAGTPQAQTIWVILVQAGLIDARMLQVIPPAFVPDPHPHPVREVTLDIEGFPRIVALRSEVARLRAAHRRSASGIIGESAPMQQLARRLERVAASPDLPVLITGETGTGKDLVARAVHEASPRREGPFVAENAGAFPEGTLASELFGHVRGAFTGAQGDRKGLFALAHGGTLFLDEVAELPMRVQAHLLRVLQDGRYRPVGAERTRHADVRLLSATHRDLDAMVAEGAFREDLLYRLRGAGLHVPPLRDRPDDVPLLVAHFLTERGSTLSVAPGAMQRLMRAPWPGNVRQLRAEVVRWTVFVDDVVGPGDLELEPVRGPSRSHGVPRPLAEAVAEVERASLEAALAHTAGNLSQAARLLEIDRNTLKRKLARYQLRS
ncbi:MAG: sigma-54 dependent transcriptional regulator [Myxococcota bacterium]